MLSHAQRWGEYLHHLRVWLSRFGHRRCWRIHSPFAYQFVREVVFAAPTAADKARLATALHSARHDYHDHTWQRYHRLVYRLALHQATHHTTPSTPLRWVVIAPDGQSALLPYLHAAAAAMPTCDISVACYTPEAFAQAVPTLPALLYLDHTEADQLRTLWPLLATAVAHTLLIVRPIHHTPEATALWQCLEHHQHTVVTFDLYYLGLALFRKGLSKEAHKLCF